MKIQLLVLILFLVNCTNHNARVKTEPLSWQHCYQSFEKHIIELSGSDALNCGFFTQESANKDKMKARDCLNLAIKQELPFRIGHKSFGYDSWFCDVAIHDNYGKLWSFFYDSDVTGSNSEHAVLWVSECLDIDVEAGRIGMDSFFSLKHCSKRQDVVEKLLSDEFK
jgi:hypothetical protein